jgi:hypothetical protein
MWFDYLFKPRCKFEVWGKFNVAFKILKTPVCGLKSHYSYRGTMSYIARWHMILSSRTIDACVITCFFVREYSHYNNCDLKEQALMSPIGHFTKVPLVRSSFAFADPIIPDSVSWSNPINHYYPHLLSSLQLPGSSVWPGGLHTAPGLTPIQDHTVRMSTWAGWAIWRLYGLFCQLLYSWSLSLVKLALQNISPPYSIFSPFICNRTHTQSNILIHTVTFLFASSIHVLTISSFHFTCIFPSSLIICLPCALPYSLVENNSWTLPSVGTKVSEITCESKSLTFATPKFQSLCWWEICPSWTIPPHHRRRYTECHEVSLWL